MGDFEFELFVGMLRRYAHEVRECAQRHGLYCGMKFHTDGAKRRGHFVTRVLAELIEANHATDDQDHWTEQMADVVLTVLSVCDKEGVDIAGAIERKRLINVNRPYLHKEENSHDTTADA